MVACVFQGELKVEENSRERKRKRISEREFPKNSKPIKALTSKWPFLKHPHAFFGQKPLKKVKKKNNNNFLHAFYKQKVNKIYLNK